MSQWYLYIVQQSVYCTTHGELYTVQVFQYSKALGSVITVNIRVNFGKQMAKGPEKVKKIAYWRLAN
jgi:hypothetical protein